MSIFNMKEEIVRHLDDITAIKDVCGELRVLSSRDDFEPASLAVATIFGPSIPHYHMSITEFYFVLEGVGRVIVGREHHDVTTGTMIIIPCNRAHYTIPREIMKVLAFSVPGWFEEDQTIIREGDAEVAHYSKFGEKFTLIDELLTRSNLGFREPMTREEKEALDAERQVFVLRTGWNNMSIPELRELLTAKPQKNQIGA